MKVVVDCRYVRTGPPDGISRYTVGVVTALARLHPVTLLISDPGQLDRLPHLPHVLVGGPTRISELWVARAVNRLEPDIVFTPMQTMGSWGRRYRLVLTVHDLIYYRHRRPPGRFPWPLRLLWRLYHLSWWPQRLLLNRADAVVTVSETTKRLIEQHRLTRRPVAVVANAADPPVARPVVSSAGQRRGDPWTSLSLVYSGSFLPYKNVDTLAQALHRLPGFTLHLISPITDAERDRLVGLAPPDSIVCHNGATDEDYQRIVRGALALVSASRDEGFGIPLVEAMAVGVPIVVSDIPIFREVGGSAALYADPDVPASFASAIGQLTHPEEWQHRSAAAHQESLKYSWDISAGRLLGFLDHTFRDHSRSSGPRRGAAAPSSFQGSSLMGSSLKGVTTQATKSCPPTAVGVREGLRSHDAEQGDLGRGWNYPPATRRTAVRILIGADQYPEYISGAAMFTTRLARGLAARGHTVDLVCPAAEGGRRESVHAGLRTHRLNAVRLPSQPPTYVGRPGSVRREVATVMSAVQPDVVHVQSHFSVGRSLIQAAKAAGVPVLATNHFMPENVLPHVPLLRHAPHIAARAAWHDLARVYRQADAITVPTQRAVQLLASATDLPPAQAISGGIDLERFHPGPTLAPHVPTLLFVGRLEKEKHVDQLLHALSLVAADRNVRLDIVGNGSLRSNLDSLSRRLGLQDRVTFHGAVTDDDLLTAYRRADVFVMPGTAELQSLATLEAMAAGKPIVAADAMALPHLVADGDNGYLFRSGNIPGLRLALIRLLDDVPIRRSMGERSLQKAREHSLDATVDAYEDCYQRLIDHVGQRAHSSDKRTLAMAS